MLRAYEEYDLLFWLLLIKLQSPSHTLRKAKENTFTHQRRSPYRHRSRRTAFPSGGRPRSLFPSVHWKTHSQCHFGNIFFGHSKTGRQEDFPALLPQVTTHSTSVFERDQSAEWTCSAFLNLNLLLRMMQPNKSPFDI